MARFYDCGYSCGRRCVRGSYCGCGFGRYCGFERFVVVVVLVAFPSLSDIHNRRKFGDLPMHLRFFFFASLIKRVLDRSIERPTGPTDPLRRSETTKRPERQADRRADRQADRPTDNPTS